MRQIYAVYTRADSDGEWNLYGAHPSEEFACNLAGALVRLNQSASGKNFEALVLKFEGSKEDCPSTVEAEAIRHCIRWTSDPAYTNEERERIEQLEREFQEEEHRQME